MLNKQAWLPTIAVLAILTLCGCTPPKQYHTVYQPVCVSATPRPSPECETHALQRLPTASEGNHYLLGFIEFDDQGQLWDRQQMSAVVNKLIGEAANKNLLMVVFVHGWKHNAAPDDANVATFREMLRELTDAEVKLAKGLGTSARAPKRPPREIVGVYIGWRGASVTLPLIKELTFWDRKNTAQKVGRGGVTEVLSRLESIKRVKQHIGESGHTRLVIVGHSFGGAVVYTALSHILENRFVRTTGPAGEQSDVGGFGDLVVLINPALEAMEFSALSDMSTERGTYFPSQLPVMLEMTSEADYATRYAFPAGRWLSTLFEETREQTRLNKVTDKQESISESDANITAIGHFKPYRTHRLYPVESQIAAQSNELNTRDATAYSVRLFRKTCRDWRHDKPGSQTEFGALMLERTITSAGRNPYLFAYVDKRLISGHNDIDDPRIIEFIKQVILISTQPAASGCASRPNSKYVPPNREDSAVGRTGRRAG